MAKLWAVNYQPPTGDPVVYESEDVSTPEGEAANIDHIKEAWNANATQITLLFDLMG